MQDKGYGFDMDARVDEGHQPIPLVMLGVGVVLHVSQPNRLKGHEEYGCSEVAEYVVQPIVLLRKEVSMDATVGDLEQSHHDDHRRNQVDDVQGGIVVENVSRYTRGEEEEDHNVAGHK